MTSTGSKPPLWQRLGYSDLNVYRSLAPRADIGRPNLYSFSVLRMRFRPSLFFRSRKCRRFFNIGGSGEEFKKRRGLRKKRSKNVSPPIIDHLLAGLNVPRKAIMGVEDEVQTTQMQEEDYISIKGSQKIQIRPLEDLRTLSRTARMRKTM